MTSTERINPLSKAQVGRLYDILHTESAGARDAYLAAEHLGEEEFHRGWREAMDVVISELDILVDENAGIVE